MKLAKSYVYKVASTRALTWTNNGKDYLTATMRYNNHKYTIYKHVLVFFIHNGYVPEEVDHIDGNTLNNEPSNLRDSTRSQNCSNRKVFSNNALGVKGVRKVGNSYQVRVCHNGKTTYMRASSLEEAQVMSKRIRQSLHKEFANEGKI